MLDRDLDNMIDFRDFAWCLGVIARADMPEKLKLLYRLHQPPALLHTDVDEISSPVSGRSPEAT